MTGAAAPSTGRYMVVTKVSAHRYDRLLQLWRHLGARKLEICWLDAIIVEGEAPEWAYIVIDDDKIEIRDASDLVGMKSELIDDTLKERHGQDFFGAEHWSSRRKESAARCHHE